MNAAFCVVGLAAIISTSRALSLVCQASYPFRNRWLRTRLSPASPFQRRLCLLGKGAGFLLVGCGSAWSDISGGLAFCTGPVLENRLTSNVLVLLSNLFGQKRLPKPISSKPALRRTGTIRN